jgi:hypothetical protein
MPLATELLPLLSERLQLPEMQEWLNDLRKRLSWLERDQQSRPSALNIEQLFHVAHFDIEVHRLRHHLAPVGRSDGAGTPWNAAQSISAWLSYLEEALCDVIFEQEDNANLDPIKRWAKSVNPADTVVTFNYDTLAESALAAVGKDWNHGTGISDAGTAVCKLHGSIDWIVAHRSDNDSNLELLYDKKNANRSRGATGHVEDNCRLWRCRTREQLRTWLSGRELQSVPKGALPRTVGIAGLGAYKQIHQIPGAGRVWAHGMRARRDANLAIVIGFSMSDLDMMAQLQFAEVVRNRQNRSLRVIVIDPCISEEARNRFRRVFGQVEFIGSGHETIDWTMLPPA